jgi:ribosomal protein S3AE
MIYPLILDENISNSIADALELEGYDIYPIRKISRGISDNEIIQLSNQEKRVGAKVSDRLPTTF